MKFALINFNHKCIEKITFDIRKMIGGTLALIIMNSPKSEAARSEAARSESLRESGSRS